ncbi:16S rRNA (cytosine(967)-C(5))-methyltransferase RsmB [Metabacillus indicus]|uniref:16S rRNA (cytosine(967)-C(5))-methyltransferase RsmB n=1 Tax=Metabacillus indicus TaxID=246786 RepID=UPI002A04F6EB|nr:16S rRNA (cytosine(967)-C(5))-methyltransferase RsmB [Metabacillus indicus]MDX8288316.1 16S rRNA (cytosine(967)-C(5))-methyltransferase RsmB [Metabacillus indicus]
MKKNNVRETALETLLMIEKNQAYSHLLLNSMIKKHGVKEIDIPLLTEIVYGTLQRRDTLDFYLAPFIKNAKKTEQWVQNLLRLSVYQMVYLDRVPERAVFHEAVEIAKHRGHKGIASFVNGILRSIQRQGLPSTAEIKDEAERIAVETSFPLWLVKRWISQLGAADTKKMCEATLTPPSVSARVNFMKNTRGELMEQLLAKGFQIEEGDLTADAIKSLKGSLVQTEEFKEGRFTIQDESSMLVARTLAPEKGDAVLDACAAPGGKSTHIAEILENTGTVYSLDLHKQKVSLITEQAERLGLTNIKTEAMDSRKVHERFKNEQFDKILVDAPCSGLGVVRRKPDIKYTKSAEDVKRLSQIQLEILSSAAPLLKKGGTLVYSTCTIDSEENGQVVDKFLAEHSEFELDSAMADRLPEAAKPYADGGQVQILPHYFGTDGFYIASLRKKV